MLPGPHVSRVHAGPRSLGDGELEVHLPSCVVEVVVVEVDRGVLVRNLPEVGLTAPPAVTRHRPRRHVDGPPVQPVGRGVRDPVGRKVPAKVPRRRESIARCLGRGALTQRLQLAGIQRTGKDTWIAYLAVEVSGDDRVARLLASPVAGHQERQGVGSRRQPAGRAGDCESRLVSGPCRDRLLVDRNQAARGVVRGGHEVPAQRVERYARPDTPDVSGIAGDPEGRSSAVVDEQAVSAAVRRPLGQDALYALSGGRRIYPGLQREAAGRTQGRGVRDGHVRPLSDGLLPSRVLSRYGRLERLVLESGAARRLVSMD